MRKGADIMADKELIHQQGIYEQMFTLPDGDIMEKYKTGFLGLVSRLSAMASELIAIEMPNEAEKYAGDPVDYEAYGIAYSKAVLKVSQAVFGYLPMTPDLTTRKEGETVDEYCGRYLLRYLGEAKKELKKFEAPSEKKKKTAANSSKLHAEIEAAKKKAADEKAKKEAEKKAAAEGREKIEEIKPLPVKRTA